MLSPNFLFPRFLVFPPANPAIFHIANVFLSGASKYLSMVLWNTPLITFPMPVAAIIIIS